MLDGTTLLADDLGSAGTTRVPKLSPGTGSSTACHVTVAYQRLEGMGPAWTVAVFKVLAWRVRFM